MVHPILESLDQLESEKKCAGGLRSVYKPQIWPWSWAAMFAETPCSYFLDAIASLEMVVSLHQSLSNHFWNSAVGLNHVTQFMMYCWLFRCDSMSRFCSVGQSITLFKVSQESVKDILDSKVSLVS